MFLPGTLDVPGRCPIIHSYAYTPFLAYRYPSCLATMSAYPSTHPGPAHHIIGYLSNILRVYVHVLFIITCTTGSKACTPTLSPNRREGDGHDAHAQQLNTRPDQHTEQHRVLRRWPENVGVDQLQGAGRKTSYRHVRRERKAPKRGRYLRKDKTSNGCTLVPVSYTHLTLPTICSV